MFCGYDIFTHGYWEMDQKNGNAVTIKLIFLNVLLKTAATLKRNSLTLTQFIIKHHFEDRFFPVKLTDPWYYSSISERF